MSETAITTTKLDVNATLDQKSFVVIGCTGFLGKVWVALLLDRYPNVGKLYMVVRKRPGQSPEQRFWAQVASSEVFKPLREQHGEGFDDFLRAHVVPIDGDVSMPSCGLAPDLIKELHGNVHAVVNVAGVVDFSPPLDEALEVNAFGVQKLVELARALGDVPVLHTSTCFVAGNRVGEVKEVHPAEYPFPRADELDVSHWAPEREIDECLDLVKQARQRVDDAFRQSNFLDEAKRNLESKNEPARGKTLEDEIARVRRKFVETQLVEAGTERAQFWGWPNIYTYTKSIGEQVLATSGLPFTIARPSVIESSIEFPFPGWNEGINTTAPLMYAILQGLQQLPSGKDSVLDIIPVDMVAAGMVLSLAALLNGTAKPVYQLGSSDVNPSYVRRLVELSSLYKRKHYLKHPIKNPIVNFLQGHTEAYALTADEFRMRGSPAIAKVASSAAWAFKKVGIKPLAKATRAFAKSAEKTSEIVDIFLPFMTSEYIYSCKNTAELYAQVRQEDRAKLAWHPERIDWRHYILDVHGPGLAKYVFPQIEEKLERPKKPAKRHETLVSLLHEMAARHDHLVALQGLTSEGLTRFTYRELLAGANAVTARLQQLGVTSGDRVLISGKNDPTWPMAYFGILQAGAAAVPVDPALEPTPFINVLLSSGAKVAIWDASVEEKSGDKVRELVPETRVLDLHAASELDSKLVPQPVDVQGQDIASLIYTSGTTGTPKGVMLTHDNFASLLASLMPLFPLTHKDRLLSVLPLHHTFEFTCGFLLPLASGARVIYMDELNGERLAKGLRDGQVTAMVGVPALWQMLERKILSQARDKGAFAERYLEYGTDLNRVLGQKLGLDLGKVLFGSVHSALGGNIRLLVSGGAALPDATANLFAGLGLHLSEGYGLTEASPVLTVQEAGPKSKTGSVGKALPGVEVRVLNPDERGVGEVVAKGPNVMLGYAGDAEATRAVLDEQGWLHTGDLGKLDKQGRLSIVGRIKDVVVTATGENVYPDDVENVLGPIKGIAEYAVVGVEDPNGGERVALLARPEEHDDEDRVQRNTRAYEAVKAAVAKLPMNQKPAVVQIYDAELPKTATRKVKRSEVKKIIERIVNAATPILHDSEATTPIRAVVASLAKKKPSEIHAGTKLQADLGFDSLAMVDLVLALEQQLGSRALPQDLSRVETVGEIERLLGEAPQVVKKRVEAEKKSERIVVPSPIRDAVKSFLGKSQEAFYERVMETRVTGRAYIPHNRNTIVVANHSSHLDMGLVKHALGTYGQDIVSFAAADYFFDDKWKRAYFENFTNLAALDRKNNMSKTLREAGEILASGKTVLIFPEGTRSPNGEVQEFKRLFAHLAMTYDVDVLPLYLRGTYDALPKGGALVTRREVSAHIGPPLMVQDFTRLFGKLPFNEQVRRVAEVTQHAVLALKNNKVLDLHSTSEDDLARLGEEGHPLITLFDELARRFQRGAVDEPVSFYFTLGNEPEAKWTLRADKESCVITMGKPEGGVADCVLKTTPTLFTRIVREAYLPGVDEFMSGAIKSNDVGLLGTFQRLFNLAKEAEQV